MTKTERDERSEPSDGGATRRSASTPTRVRTKALIHMQRLLATSTAVAGAITSAAAACHPKGSSSDAGADAVAFGPPTVEAGPVIVDVPPGGFVDAGPIPVDPNLSVNDRTHGYAVVDPMPTPAHCPDLDRHIKASATRVGDDIVLRATNGGGFAGFKYTGSNPTVYGGGTLVGVTYPSNGNAVVTIKPTAPGVGAGKATTITLHGFCNKGRVTMSFIVHEDLKVTVSEY